MPISELCSPCYLARLRMMQSSQYSIFNVYPWFQTALEYAKSACALSVPTNPQPPLVPVQKVTPICVSGIMYTTQIGDTCDSIAIANSVSSASIFSANTGLQKNCTALIPGQDLCIPLKCQTYQLQPSDDCYSASIGAGVANIALYNTWITSQCDNLHIANATLGTVLCASPAGGTYVPGTATNTSSFPGSELTGYGTTPVSPPSDATVAPGSLLECGGWYTVVGNDTCGSITVNAGLTLSLFAIVNPSIDANNCTTSLIVGNTYCVAPLRPSDDSSPLTWSDFGCWSNADPSSAVLTGDEYTNATSMSVELCANYCSLGDYAFFGLEASDTCTCGSEVGINSVQISSTQCDLACAGNSSEICGGSATTSVFGIVPSLSFQFSDLGCFSDSPTTQALSGSSLLGQSNNSIEACADFCLPTYSFFGVENGQDCWCGDSISTQAQTLEDTSCNANCTGTNSETCGGSSAIEIYGVKTPITTQSTSTVSSSTTSSGTTTTTTSS